VDTSRPRARLAWAGACTTLFAVLAAVPAAAAQATGGSEWAFVAVTGSDHLAAVDLDRARVAARFPVPAPQSVAVPKDRRLVLVTSPRANTATLIHAKALRVVHVFRALGGPADVEFAPDGRFAYVVEARHGTVAVLDIRARRVVSRVWIGRGPHDLAVRPDGKRVWVTRERWTHRSPSVLDTSSPRHARVLGRAGGRHIRDAAFSNDGSRVWVTYWRSGIVGEIRAYSRLGSLRSQQTPGALLHRTEVDELDRVWVSDARRGSALSLGRRNGPRPERLSPCPGAHDIAVGPGRGRVVVACAAGDFVLVFDPVTRRSTRVRVGESPHGVVIAFLP
jgi:DNA-binding beta-propeller fold protein YncE